METLENIAQNQNKKTELFNKDILDIKTFSEKISKMYESEFEEAFKQIIILSKDDFMSFISNGIQSLLIEMYGEENLNNKNLKNIQQKSFSHIEKEYINHYIKLLKYTILHSVQITYFISLFSSIEIYLLGSSI